MKILRKIAAREAVINNIKYVDDRRKGLITSFKTKYNKLNYHLMGGIEGSTILTISALSGAGKSTLAKTIRDSIQQLNPDMKFKMLLFNFEMLSLHQIGRSIVSKKHIPLRKLYSVDESLSDNEMKQLEEYYRELMKQEVYFVEEPGTADDIVATIKDFWERECKLGGYTLITEVDHVLLTKGNDGMKEKDKVDALMVGLIDTKKYISSRGGSSITIALSQMNRDIRSIERIKSSDMHRPLASDLFGASAIEFASDYILFSHMPAKLGITSYTTAQLPTRYKIGTETYMMPYFELVKNRSGEPDLTFPLYNKLEYFDFDEMEVEVFDKLKKDFHASECMEIPVIPLQKTLL